MSKRIFIVLLLSVQLLLLGAHRPVHSSNQDHANVPDWGPRLAALHPEDPMAYFDLAEEVLDIATNKKDFDLVKQLFASLDSATASKVST